MSLTLDYNAKCEHVDLDGLLNDIPSPKINIDALGVSFDKSPARRTKYYRV